MFEQNELGGSYVINEAGEKVLVHRTGHVNPGVVAPAAEVIAPAIPDAPIDASASKPEPSSSSIKARFAGWLTGDQAGVNDDQQSNEVEE